MLYFTKFEMKYARRSSLQTQAKLKAAIKDLQVNSTPTISEFATWCLTNYSEIAFHSVRALADIANVNANTVVRFSKELGFKGYEDLRQNVQSTLRTTQTAYSKRADALIDRDENDLFSELKESYTLNSNTLFQPSTRSAIVDAANCIRSAEKVFTVGVRSSYSIAHYFSYVGSMAFDNITRAPAEPGAIMDQLAKARESDVLVAISFSYYSAEVVRAAEIARAKRMKVIAITDSYSSPLTIDAAHVIEFPIEGPQYMPTLSAAFMAVELILAALASHSSNASGNIQKFEEQILKYGGYIS